MMGRVAVTKMGLNNASVIVWAISEFFFFSSFFGILTNNYSIYNCNLRNTRQKRAQTAPVVLFGP